MKKKSWFSGWVALDYASWQIFFHLGKNWCVLAVAAVGSIATSSYAADCWQVVGWSSDDDVGAQALVQQADCTTVPEGYGWTAVQLNYGSEPNDETYLRIHLEDNRVTNGVFEPLLVFSDYDINSKPRIFTDLIVHLDYSYSNKTPLFFEPPEQGVPVAGARVRLRHAETNACISSGSSNGAVATHTACDSSGITFVLDDAGSGYLRLRDEDDNQCLYAWGENGGTMNSWVCWDDPNMLFQLSAAANGYRLRHIDSNQCAYATDSGSNVYHWGCWNDSNMEYFIDIIEYPGWTEWFDRDNPGGSGDWETLSDFEEICDTPVDIDCETTSGVNWTLTGETLICNTTSGLICRNSDQADGSCEDYRVRFLCSDNPSSGGEKGMTWGVASHDSDLDISKVHCYGTSTQEGDADHCNPYQGDTSCSTALPVLCVKVDGTPRPPYGIPVCGSSCAMNDEFYNGWIEGSAELTAPVQGNAFATLDDVNAYCEAQLGPDYRVAEHHDGRWVYGMDENNFYGSTWPLTTSSGGWGFYAPGQLADDSRFWVHINGQNANCWDRTATTTRSLSVNSSGASGVAITGNPSAYSGTTNYTKTSIPSGTTITLTVPAAGSASTTFSFWSGCDAIDAAARTCTVSMSANKAVTANFVLNSYTVTPSVGANGSINPDSDQTVNHGNTASFTLTPDIGYGIDTVEGCNGSLNGNVYTTGAITGDCAVTASFITAYTVIPKARQHGSISPDTRQQVSEGHTASFTITPDAGYSIRRVRGCGGTLDGNTYTTGPITGKCRVKASFKKNPVVISKARRHGSIAPTGRQSVSKGTVLSFTITPDAGYTIKKVRGCGGSLDGNTYTTAPITRKCKVKAKFRRSR